MLNIYLNYDKVIGTFVLIFMFIGLYFDITIRKIPNKFNLSIILFGVFLLVLRKGVLYLPEVMWEIIVIFGVCLIIYSLKVIGAGDLKFFIALTPLIGMMVVLKLIIMSIIVGALNYTIYFLIKGKLRIKFKNFFKNGSKTRMRYMHNIVIGYFLYQLFNFFGYCI